jgi:hypothetical protein
MKQGRLIGFNAKALSEQIMAKAVEEQTRRLIEYAENKIKEIGNKINSYNSRHHMDRTGNLLNSLCWGVAYSGELKASGFFRNAQSTKISYLHEWSTESSAFPVDGHSLAAEYIERYGKSSWKGRWRVFFAILAPYWGFWEEGFNLKHGFSKTGAMTFKQFAVMTEVYDQVSEELKPAKVNFKITKSHHYSRNSKDKNSLARKYKSRVDNPYSKFYDRFERRRRGK